MFVFEWLLVTLCPLEVLNNDVIFAGNRRIKQTSLKVLHLLMQNSPCSDKVMQSLETFFRFSTLRTSKSTLFGWTITLASSNERSSSKSLKSLLLRYQKSVFQPRVFPCQQLYNPKEVNNTRGEK
jgi:hypothetical protein